MIALPPETRRRLLDEECLYFWHDVGVPRRQRKAAECGRCRTLYGADK